MHSVLFLSTVLGIQLGLFCGLPTKRSSKPGANFKLFLASGKGMYLSFLRDNELSKSVTLYLVELMSCSTEEKQQLVE